MRKRTQAFKLMKVIRETDQDHWDTLEAEGDVPDLDITSELLSHIGLTRADLVTDVSRLGRIWLLTFHVLVYGRVSADGAWPSGR